MARFSEAVGVGGAGVALKERERDPAVELREHARRPGQKPGKLGAQLVASATRVATRSSRARVSARSALV